MCLHRKEFPSWVIQLCLGSICWQHWPSYKLHCDCRAGHLIGADHTLQSAAAASLCTGHNECGFMLLTSSVHAQACASKRMQLCNRLATARSRY